MDKRAIIYVILLAVSLYFVQNYFFPSKSQSQQQIELAKEKQQQNEDLKKYQKNISDLPISNIYKDEETKEQIGSAVVTDGHLITIASSTEMPEKIFLKTSDNKVLSYKLSFKTYYVNDPILYSLHDTSLTFPNISPWETSFVQVVTLDKENSSVFLGEYSNGFISFPISTPNTNAIVLFEYNEKYYPLAFYDFKLQKLRFLEDFSNFSSVITTKIQQIDTKHEQTTEDFYVLENDYVQLVFSTKGAALAEINLPLKSEKNTNSIIRPIEFDKILYEKYPENDYFPQKPYYLMSDEGKKRQEKGSLGGYYPLIRRSIYNQNKSIKSKLPANYYALNISSKNENLENAIYKVTQFTKDTIQFEILLPQRRIVKTFSLANEAAYCFNLNLKIDGDCKDLWLTSGIPEVELMSGASSPDIKYKMLKGTKSVIEKVSLPKTFTLDTYTYPDWICNSNGYLGLILDPLNKINPGFEAIRIDGTLAPTKLSIINSEDKAYPANKYPGFTTLLPLKNTPNISNIRIFAGPFESNLLKSLDKYYSDPKTNYNPDYIEAQSFHGWLTFISQPFAKFIQIILNFLYLITHSWGFAIILVTIIFRIMLYPLNAWSIKSMHKTQEINPEIQAIQAKYKKDPKKVQLETMNLYRKKGINPLMGCLPMLIQLPFLIGMFNLLKSNFSMRGEPFIPGWINNLTAPDVLFSWNISIPFIGNQLHLLPILLGVIMFVQQKMTTKLPKDKSLLTDQQKQQKMMGNMMLIMFTVLFYKLPSGLNIYFLFFNLLGILQQWLMTKTTLKKKAKIIPFKQTNK